jgi:HSP20 family protein
MAMRSLIPFAGSGALMRPDVMLFGSLHREIDRLFDEVTRGVGPQGAGNILPSIDVTETDKEIVVTAELPGLERKDVDISLENDTLTIRGEKREQADQGDKNVQLSERRYGVFYRVLQLPTGIDPSSVQASMSNGVLKITIPKPARSEAKKIEVKEAA